MGIWSTNSIYYCSFAFILFTCWGFSLDVLQGERVCTLIECQRSEPATKAAVVLKQSWGCFQVYKCGKLVWRSCERAGTWKVPLLFRSLNSLILSSNRLLYGHVLLWHLLHLTSHPHTHSALPFLGGFAFVYEAQDTSSGKDYALKVRKMLLFWHVLLIIYAILLHPIGCHLNKSATHTKSNQSNL